MVAFFNICSIIISVHKINSFLRRWKARNKIAKGAIIKYNYLLLAFLFEGLWRARKN